ncbi:MAG: hypothetical protein ABIK09_09440 [Pseudomonadota bacterium]
MTRNRTLALVALAASVAACGVELRRPLIAYDFDNPILNERWLQAHCDPLPAARTPNRELVDRSPEPVPEVVTAKAVVPPVAAAADPVVASPVAPVSPRGVPATPLPAITAGEQGPPVGGIGAWTPLPQAKEPAAQEEVPAPVKTTAAPGPEIADAAGRLVGIRSSFDQDTFLKHVLFVSNVALDTAPAEGLVRWVWERYGKAGSPSLAPGHLVFLGWGGRARMVGVVEEVDEHGTAQFVTVQGDEVKRLKITAARPRARRDEHTGRILNSAVGKGRLAGETLMGIVAVVPDATGSAALATAE